MKQKLLREITPLTQSDCFTLFSRVKTHFDFPLHYHEEFELNFIENAKGARRVVGDHMEEVDDMELVLVGPNLQHAWFTHHCRSHEIREITIQFHKDLFDDKLLNRNQLAFIRTMFQKSSRGILFSRETTQAIGPRIQALKDQQGFDSVLELLSILHDLSTSRNFRLLSDSSFNLSEVSFNSRRIEKTYDYMTRHFDKTITLADVAKIAGMTEVSFSRFYKSRTGNTFVDSLNELRLGHACRMLIDTTHSVGEIAYKCGFNNISNFNRIFKKKKGCTPKEFREEYTNGSRIFI